MTKGYAPQDLLFSTSTSIIEQTLVYPIGAPKVTSAIVTMIPGRQTGWHCHDVPLFAYTLGGELTVDYGSDGTKTYRVGDSFMEAFQSDHDGPNTGPGTTRILAVFMGSDSAANTVLDKTRLNSLICA